MSRGPALNRHTNAPSEALRQYTRPSAEPKITSPRYTVGGESTSPPAVNVHSFRPYSTSKA